MKKIVFAKVKRKIGKELVQLDVFDCVVPEIIKMSESDYKKSRKKGMIVCLEYIYQDNEYKYNKIIGILNNDYFGELAKYEILKVISMGIFKGRIKCIGKETSFLKDVMLLDINDVIINNFRYILTLKKEMEVHNGDILSGNYNILKLETVKGIKYLLLSDNCRKLKNKKNNKNYK